MAQMVNNDMLHSIDPYELIPFEVYRHFTSNYSTLKLITAF